MQQVDTHRALTALGEALEARSASKDDETLDHFTLYECPEGKNAAEAAVQGIRGGLFAETHSNMLMYQDKVYEYLLVAFDPRWTIAYVHATSVEKGSTVIEVEENAVAAMAIRHPCGDNGPQRDESLNEESRIARLLTALTQTCRSEHGAVISLFWHRMESPSEASRIGSEAALTLAGAEVRGRQPSQPSTGGDRPYSISYEEVAADIWLATAHRLRPVLTERRMEPEPSPAAQYLLRQNLGG